MTADFDLFAFADVHRMYRRTDPPTSPEAAIKTVVRNVKSDHHALILSALKRAGRPMAAEEIADATPIGDHVAVNRRLPELVREGLIERTTERHKNRSGSSAYRYRMVAR